MPAAVVDLDTDAGSQSARSSRCCFVAVVDVSSSMSSAIRMVRETLHAIATNLLDGDELAIVTFGNESELLFPLQQKGWYEKDDLDKAITEVVARGSTNLWSGLYTACHVLTAVTSSVCHILLLSDGQPNIGLSARDIGPALHEAIHTADHTKVFVHSLGFTNQHAADLLKTLTVCGSAGPGLYYSLLTREDIPAAVGDCLGNVKDVQFTNVLITARFLNGEKEEMTEGICSAFDGTEVMKETEIKIGACAPNTSKSFVFVGPKGDLSPSFALITASYIDSEGAQHTQTVSTTVHNVPLERTGHPGSSLGSPVRTENDICFESCAKMNHLLTHLLRIRSAHLLQRAADPADTMRTLEKLSIVHDQILAALRDVQKMEDPLVALKDEKVLSALDQDIGEAIEKLSSSTSYQPIAIDRSRFLQFAHEHMYQQSASSFSNVRSAYATKEQVAMRLRFLAANDSRFDVNKAIEDKSSIFLDELGLTESDIEARKEQDDLLTCYVSLDNWRTAHIGIGLVVLPRTARDRIKKLIPCTHLVDDYISADAYNTGVRTMVQAGNRLDRDLTDGQGEHSVITSSIRSRINAWLPLYINSTNWKYVKAFTPSAFSIIATQFNDSFIPEYAVTVCTKILMQQTVKFVLEDEKVSDKALQMYCGVHRLFLQMVKEYPDITASCEKKLRNFIDNPFTRSRAQTPDLGDLILLLTATDRINWGQLREVYIQESFRRNVMHINHNRVHSFKTCEELFEFWMGETNGGRVLQFNLLFLEVVARPDQTSMEDVRQMYDGRWGLLPAEKLQQLKEGFQLILTQPTLPELLHRLGFELPNDAIAELLLWAFQNKDEKPRPIYEGIPKQGGDRYAQWMDKCEMIAFYQPPAELPFVPPQPVKKCRPYDGLFDTLKTLRESMQSQPLEDGTSSSQPSGIDARVVETWERRNNDNAERTLMLTKLRKQWTEEWIHNELQLVLGVSVDSVTLLRSKRTGKSKRTAFAVFKSKATAQYIARLGKWSIELNGRLIRVRLCSPYN
eukprot:GILJ01014402.1.p1 GENE.GILJ01014402.1~~GILJ01014402.1.p1  ORF type:complete len:1019 (-),score=120.84 GILJ01014402.1:28-3084(-)